MRRPHNTRLQRTPCRSLPLRERATICVRHGAAETQSVRRLDLRSYATIGMQRGSAMKTLTGVLVGILLLSGLTACGSFSTVEGTKVSDEQIASFVKGTTTKAEVVSALGGPQDTRLEGGKQVLVYRYKKTCSYCSGNEDATTTFIFNAQNILEDVMKSGS